MSTRASSLTRMIARLHVSEQARRNRSAETFLTLEGLRPLSVTLPDGSLPGGVEQTPNLAAKRCDEIGGRRVQVKRLLFVGRCEFWNHCPGMVLNDSQKTLQVGGGQGTIGRAGATGGHGVRGLFVRGTTSRQQQQQGDENQSRVRRLRRGS